MSTVILRRRRLGKTSCREIASRSSNDIKVVINDRDEFPNDTSLVIRWGCTGNLPNGVNVINSAKGIHEVNNKVEFRKLLGDTNLIPKTFFSVEEWLDNSDQYKDVIVRPAFHSQGRNLLKLSVYDYQRDTSILEDFINEHSEFYISEYVPKVAEFRVFVVSGRAACVARKYPADENSIAWNVAQGGRFENVRWDNWNLRVVKAAIEGFNLTSLDFGGVDVMVNGDNKPFILEINSAPSLTSPYRQEKMANCFDYIIANGKERIPLVEEKGGYRKFIHPAVCESAL